MPLITDSDMTALLTDATADDLGILADYITDKGEGRISLSSEVCKTLHQARTSGKFSPVARAYIAEELQPPDVSAAISKQLQPIKLPSARAN